MLPNHPGKIQLYIYNYTFTLGNFKIQTSLAIFFPERLTLHETPSHPYSYSNTAAS